MDIMLGIPSRSWALSIGTFRSIWADARACTERGIRLFPFDEAGNTDIAKARETIMMAFLQSSCDGLIFVDDDVAWSIGAIPRLATFGLDLIGATYPKRDYPITYPVKLLTASTPNNVGLLEVAGLPAGLLYVSRNCAERMKREHNNRSWESLTNEQGLPMGEDYSFCARWRLLGGKVWLDTTIRCGHIGPHCYTGDLTEWLKST